MFITLFITHVCMEVGICCGYMRLRCETLFVYAPFNVPIYFKKSDFDRYRFFLKIFVTH